LAGTRCPSGAALLALLYVLGAVGCLLGAAFPVSPHAPVGLGQALGATGLIVGGGLLLWRHRVNILVINVGLLLDTALVSALVACSKTAAGVAITGLDYMCVALIAAYYLPRTIARVQTGLAVAGFTAGVLAGGVPRVAVMAFVIAATVAATGEVFARLVDQLRRQAATDPLTGLANRGCFRAAATREIALALRGGRAFTLAMLDLDDFKAFNDSNGHLAGDALLTELADAWRGQLRRGDVLARVGGDEFALLMPGTALSDAARVLERLQGAYPAHWSTGAVRWAGEDTLDALLERADERLYEHKDRRKSVTQRC
jgi:diguanylate cyclase (GGDEF)-like protein